MPDRLLAVLERSRALGFLGPGPVDEHVDHALALAVAYEAWHHGPPTSLLDLGAGGGIPGLVLAARWTGARVVLLDSAVRRCAFLVEAVDELELATSVTVVNARAEAAARTTGLEGSFPLVTSRSFGPPAVTAECAVRFLADGGALVVAEPPEDGAPGTSRWPAEGLALLGLSPARPLTATRRLVALTRERPLDGRFPRRDGVPSKRPLF